MQPNIARNGKKISWIQIICLLSCLIAEVKTRVSGLEDGVQDVLVVGGDVEQMPFEDGKSLSTIRVCGLGMIGEGGGHIYSLIFTFRGGNGVWGLSAGQGMS
jgi:hypothetical protein